MKNYKYLVKVSTVVNQVTFESDAKSPREAAEEVFSKYLEMKAVLDYDLPEEERVEELEFNITVTEEK